MWVSSNIEHWPISKLVPYACNARTHSDEQVAQIAASIAEFGFTTPILAGLDGVADAIGVDDSFWKISHQFSGPPGGFVRMEIVPCLD